MLAIALLAVACTAPGGVGGPGPGDVVLRQTDVPNGFLHCSYSGPIADYLQRMRAVDSQAAQLADASWAAARPLGAQAASVAGYGAAGDACKVGVGRSTGQSVATLVVQAKDSNAAIAIYQHGLLGFTTPPGQPEQQNLVVGAATALGQYAWTLRLDAPAPGIYVACWQDRTFVTLLVAVGLPSETAHQMALRVDQRVA